MKIPNMTISGELPSDVVDRLMQIGAGLPRPVRVSLFADGAVLAQREAYREVAVFDSGGLLELVLMGPNYVVCLSPGSDYASIELLEKFEHAVGLNIPKRPEGYAPVPMQINGRPLEHIASLGWVSGGLNSKDTAMGPYMGLKRTR